MSRPRKRISEAVLLPLQLLAAMFCELSKSYILAGLLSGDHEIDAGGQYGTAESTKPCHGTL